MRLPSIQSAPAAVAVLLSLCVAQDVAQDAAQDAAVDASTLPVPRSPGEDAEAHAWLERLAVHTTRQSFAAAATLTIRRPGQTRELLLRIYYHQPLDRWLLRVDGRVRERGMRVLLANQRTHVRFPAAELTVELPPALGGERLLGSDFGVDDLAVLADAGRRFEARILGREVVDQVRLVRLELLPRQARTSMYGSIRLTLGEQDAAPHRLEFRSEHGAVVRRVEMEGADALPSLWTATTPGRDGWESTLEVVHYDPSPMFHEQLFTVEGLAR
jgi:hypothetical protein